jgi:deaminated glutathione amidase
MTSGIDPLANAATVCTAVSQAAREGAAMLFAPEMSGLIDRDRARAAPHILAEEQSPFVAAVRDAAAKAGVWVHLGSLPVAGPDGRSRNRSLVIAADGSIAARYDKIHLFDIDLPGGESWRESSAYGPGQQAVVVDTPVGRLGLTICYDLRFPKLFAALADAGADVIAVPAAFTVPTGSAHWHVLLRARALDQGCFIVAAAQAGRHADGRDTYGHSLVVDPWGDMLIDAGSDPAVGEALIYTDIDRNRIAEIRRRLPIRSHARPFAATSDFGR